MSNTIKLKRGSGSDPSASDLVTGEIAVRTDTGKLFTKKDNGNVAEIGGSGISDGDKGDITVSNSGDTFTIDNGVVTSAKIANLAIVNNDISNSAAIAGSKISPTFTSDITIQNTSPQLFLVDSNNNSDYSVENEDGTFRIRDTTNSAVRMTINSSGQFDFEGNVDCNSGLDVTGAITGTVSSANTTMLNLTANMGTNNNRPLLIKAPATDSSSEPFIISTGNSLQVNIDDQKTLFIDSNGQVNLHHNGSAVKLHTTTTGISVGGNIAVTGTVDGVDIAARNTLFGELTSSSGVLTNGVTATTQSASDNSTKVATTAYTDTAISNLVDSAPGTLNTLNELAAALGDDANFSTTVTNSIATKMPLAGGTFSGDVLFDCDGGTILFDKSENALEFADDVKIKFGGNTDFEIYHDNSATANILLANSGSINIRMNSSENAIVARQNGAVELYNNNSLKIQTGHGGEYGSFRALNGNNGWDGMAVANNKFVFMGSNSDEAVGIWNDQDNEWMVKCIRNAETQLQHNGSKKFETSSSGVTVTGNIAVSGTVDGRDVASDGSKLDGIAASATNNGSGNAITDGDKGDITVSSSGGTFIIDNDVVTTAKMINFPTQTILGRETAGTGNATTLNASQVRSIINVENGATADQSASEILTLIKTVDGAGSGLDADTVDGIAGASFLRGDVDDTTTGHLNFNRNNNHKFSLSGTNDPFFNFREGSTDKARIQWSSSGYLWIQNEEDNSVIVLRDNLGFSPDGGSTIHQIWHAGNDGSGSGLDADSLDGLGSGAFLRSNASSTALGDITFSGGTNAVTISGGSDIRFVNGDWTGNTTAPKIQGHDNRLYITGGTNGIRFRENNADRWDINGSGHFVPSNDSTYSIGTSSIRVLNGYFDNLYGSGANITNVNATTLDSIDSGSFLRSDANDTLSATITGHASNTEVLRVKSASFSSQLLYIGGWSSSNDNNIARIRTSGNLHIDSPANGGIYLNSYSSGNVHVSGNRILTTADEGSGNGIDADTLDGQHGSHYLNYNNLTNRPTIPTNNNQLTNGAGYITSASFSDVAGGGTFTGDISVSGGAGAITVNANSDIRFTNGTWSGNTTKIQHHSNYLYIVGGSSGIIFREGGNDRAIIDGSGHLRPGANNTYDLGTTSFKWKNIYTNDLNLSNEDSANDVDGTWGSYTIQEGAEDLFLINKRSGKKYKFMLEEVS